MSLFTFTVPLPAQRSAEDFEVVSPVSDDNTPTPLDLLVRAAGLEEATRPQSPVQVPVERLSPLTLAPVRRLPSPAESPTAPPAPTLPPDLRIFPDPDTFAPSQDTDSPINYERVASQFTPSPVFTSLVLPPRQPTPVTPYEYVTTSRFPSPAPRSPQTPNLQYLRPAIRDPTPVVRTPSVQYSPAPTHDSDEENVPLYPSPFRNPPCTRQHLPRHHPHQFLVLRSTVAPFRENWRPIEETGLQNLTGRIPLARDLRASLPTGSYVTPFRLSSPHTAKAHPTDRTLAERHGFTSIVLCSRLGVYQPDDHFPFGRLCYSFSTSLVSRFGQCSDLIKLAFLGTTVLLYVHDFLDGRVCFIYGYLDWTADGLPFAQDVSVSFQDSVRHQPILLRYTLSPRAPLDPLAHVPYPPLETLTGSVAF